MRRILAAALVISLPAALHGAPTASTTPAIPFTHPLVTPPSSKVLDDATIIAIFDAANTADIETGDLAAKRAKDPKVRELAAQFARDHRAVRQQGRDLATKLRITPTPPADDASARAHAEAMQMLRSKHAEEFDRAYLEHEVGYHKAVIDAVTTTLLPAIQHPELKALVEKVAPAFQAHMLAAHRLQTQLGGSTKSRSSR